MATTSNALLTALNSQPHNFLQPSLPLHTDTLAFLKHALDPLATDVATTQQRRQQEARKKRKRGENAPDEEVLRLKQVHTDGFGVDQVWEQARRVIEAARVEAEAGVRLAQIAQEFADEESVDGSEVYDEDASEDGSELGEEGVDYEVEGEDVDDEIYNGESGEDEDMDLTGALDDPDAMDDFAEEEMDIDDEGNVDQPAEEFVEDKHGLNDGFFSIDAFNKQSDFLEQQDFNGEGDGAASDEEDIDWDADPATQAGADGIAQNGTAQAEASDDEDDEEGATFGDPDAESEDDEEELDGGEMDDMMGGMGNTNSVMYQDFFAPPAQKKRKNKKGRPNPHNFPAKAVQTISDGNVRDAEGGQDEDMEATIAKVQRDLFEDESEGSEGDPEEEEEALDPGDPRSRRSAHERRQLALAEEIRKLEAANVAKREWTLQGEARAADRPMNSLLEEDLDFERAGKPVPVITAEVSESLEELIKRRILAHDFQDIIRRRPDDLATGGGKRGRLDYELSDTKSKKGLAEEYEEEHLRRTDPNFVDAKDEKTAKEQREIEALWKDISGKLDSLSSWNFRPKAPAPTMEIRTDAPVVSMEDARPAAGGEVAGASQLAPQEVYKAGGPEGEKREVVGKSGLPEGREEMDREERKRVRRRNKERSRKAGANEGVKSATGAGAAEGKKAEGKRGKNKEMLGDLKRGGVKVIGKKGEVQDVEGKEVRAQTGGQGASQYKL